ncbi:oligosaccharide flippase family protein [Mangrovibacillus sp. Mu-81]|uniref:lipopolysaccharide biosynthesis protein n=1 Tax=Mangrovibacillus sp. Mu-81 TaxID=3121478 RepID=UPI002FE4F66C
MWKRILSNDFNKNVITLLSGTTIAQAIPLIISPILTRIYSPEDFGVYALFVSIITIFGSIANAKYELAIVLPAEDEDAINIASLSLIIAALFSFSLLLIVLFLHDYLVYILGNEQISTWLYVAPGVVLLVGLFNMLNYLNTRFKNYKDISRANIYKSVVTGVVQLSIGFLKPGELGLILGQILSNITGNTRLLKNILRKNNILKVVNIKEMKRLAKEYKEYPTFTMWGGLSNTLSQNITSIFISSLYSLTILGYFSLIQRILGTPIRLVGSSIGQVYFQKAAEEKRKTGNAKLTFNSTLKKLLIISLPSFTFLFFFIDDIVTLIFGTEWAKAGNYAQLLMPLFFLRFVVTPLSITNPLFKKNKFGLLWQVGLLALTLVIFGLAKYFRLEPEVLFLTYSIVLSFYYIYFFYKIKKHSYGKDLEGEING